MSSASQPSQPRPRLRVPLALAFGVLAPLMVSGQQEQEPPAARAGPVAYPENYRRWIHVKSMAVLDKQHPLFNDFPGIHHVYVNARGLEALRQGKPYPDGSVLVLDLFEALFQSGAYLEGERVLVAVMVKDSKRFSATGGWGFEYFKKGDPKRGVLKGAMTQCFACHSKVRPEGDHVYSAWRP